METSSRWMQLKYQLGFGVGWAVWSLPCVSFRGQAETGPECSCRLLDQPPSGTLLLFCGWGCLKPCTLVFEPSRPCICFRLWNYFCDIHGANSGLPAGWKLLEWKTFSPLVQSSESSLLPSLPVLGCSPVTSATCFIYFFLISFVFLGLHPWHMEFPRLGIEMEL